MNYKDFNLGDWIGHISGVIEDESELDGNEMRDLVEFLTTLKQKPFFWEKCPYYEPDMMFDGKDEYDMGQCKYKQESKGKIGKWEILPKSEFDSSTSDHIRCTNCGREPFGDIPYMFCPNCGARMEGEKT